MKFIPFGRQRSKNAHGKKSKKPQQHSNHIRPRLETLEERLAPAVIVWDGGPSGNGADWNAAANWFDQTNLVNDVRPGATDDVQIGAAFAGITITHATASTTIRSLTSAASLQIDSGSSQSIPQRRPTPNRQTRTTRGTFTLNTRPWMHLANVNAASLILKTSTINASLKPRAAILRAAATINGAFHNAAGVDLRLERRIAV